MLALKLLGVLILFGFIGAILILSVTSLFVLFTRLYK